MEMLSFVQVQERVEEVLGRRVSEHRVRDVLKTQTPAARFPGWFLYHPASVTVVAEELDRRDQRKEQLAAARINAVA